MHFCVVCALAVGVQAHADEGARGVWMYHPHGASAAPVVVTEFDEFGDASASPLADPTLKELGEKLNSEIAPETLFLSASSGRKYSLEELLKVEYGLIDYDLK